MMRRLGIFAIAVALAAPAVALAQGKRAPAPSPASPMPQGQDDQPIQIDAATLEVRDKAKTATFSGDVQVVQGDTTLKCKTLVVFYGKEVGLPNGTSAGDVAAPTKSLPQDAQSIRRIEARGDVTVVTKDQNASGDFGVYDPKGKTITLTGNVTVSQGPNVIHGERVVVDTLSGNAHFEPDGSTASAANPAQNRVRALIIPKGGQGSSGKLIQLGPPKTN